MGALSFESFADFVRAQLRLSGNRAIDETTIFESGLGVTGDDGSELLEAVQRKYGVVFTLGSFRLRKGEYLFHPEGYGLLTNLLYLFKKKERLVVRQKKSDLSCVH